MKNNIVELILHRTGGATKVKEVDADSHSLYLSWNRLTKLEGLDKLVNLKLLDLTNNQLTEIEGLNNLVNLQSLSLGSNQLTKIDGLEKLINLKTLILSGNLISQEECDKAKLKYNWIDIIN